MQRFLPIFTTLSILALLAGPAVADFTMPETVLMSGEFSSVAWGPATVTRTDVAGPGVQFDFSGLGSSGTGLKDDYSVQDYGQLGGHGNGDFSNFGGYSLRVENVGATDLSFSLFMNTGFTGPSGTPSNDPSNNTFWQSAWQEIQSGETFVVRLDFDNARAFSISDNKAPHTQGTDGNWYSINDFDRTEVSAIGFEITGDGDGTIVVSAVPEPASIVLVAAGMSTAASLLRRRKERVL